jgi:regulator of protease activity HflC (stomatin/prohibitin superfamily)
MLDAFRLSLLVVGAHLGVLADSTLLVTGLVLAAIVLLFAVIFIWSGVRVVQQYERGVIFRLGRLVGAKGPGLFWIWPFISKMRRVDLRIITLEVPPQEVITRDNVTLKVTAVVYFYIVDPTQAVVQVQDYFRASAQIAQTTLRNVLGQSELDEILAERKMINQKLQAIIDEQTEKWGVKVTVVEIKDVELPSSMQRAMSKQAEAEREKRAKIIHAQGEQQAAATLAQAAEVIASAPAALQLRYLQTLTEIGVEKNTTVVFPVPVDFFSGIQKMLGQGGGNSSPSTGKG